MKLRISVTDLDGFRYWKEAEDMDLASLISRLRGQQEPTPQMMAGRAFHRIFEDAQPCELAKADVDGFRFKFAINHEIAVPPIRELKGERIFQTPSGEVTLVGKVDALNGTVVHDYKLTERFDVERYVDSYQWRCYLCMFGASTFVYDVFVAKYEIDGILIYDYHRLAFNAYESMVDDVHAELSELAEIVAKYVPEKCAA